MCLFLSTTSKIVHLVDILLYFYHYVIQCKLIANSQDRDIIISEANCKRSIEKQFTNLQLSYCNLVTLIKLSGI